MLSFCATLGCGLHLELIHGLTGSGIDKVITVVGRHDAISFLIRLGLFRPNISSAGWNKIYMKPVLKNLTFDHKKRHG